MGGLSLLVGFFTNLVALACMRCVFAKSRRKRSAGIERMGPAAVALTGIALLSIKQANHPPAIRLQHAVLGLVQALRTVQAKGLTASAPGGDATAPAQNDNRFARCAGTTLTQVPATIAPGSDSRWAALAMASEAVVRMSRTGGTCSWELAPAGP